MTLPATQEVRGVCQHEAAHAVVALALGHVVDDIKVEIDPAVGAYGATLCHDPHDRDIWDPERVYDDFLITLAGPALDAAAGRIHPGSMLDMDRVNSLILLLILYYGGTVESHLRQGKAIAMAILEENDDRVIALCDLIMHGDLHIAEFEVKPVTWSYYPLKENNG